MRIWPLFLLFAGCGTESSGGTGTTGPELTYARTITLPTGTHRPEILETSEGGFVLVVVQPQGPSGEVGTIKHQAYRFNADFEQISDPIPVTRVDATYGEPADHRAAMVGEEFVLVYQCLTPDPAKSGTSGGPSEDRALDQSLMLARFTLEGAEILRTPIVAKVTDFSQDNFPDLCILWTGDRLLVSTGSTGTRMKIREVDLQGQVLALHEYDTSTSGIPGVIGNSLLLRDGQVSLFSPTAPGSSAELALCAFDAVWSAAQVARFRSEELERNFPTSSFEWNSHLFVAHIARARGGDTAMETHPYSPRLLILNSALETIADLSVGENGFSHVHPTLAVSGSRLYVAWSESLQEGDRSAPQVRIEVYDVAWK